MVPKCRTEKLSLLMAKFLFGSHQTHGSTESRKERREKNKAGIRRGAEISEIERPEGEVNKIS